MEKIINEVDIFHGGIFQFRDFFYVEDIRKVEGDICEVLGLDKDKLGFYAYTLEESRRTNNYLEKGYLVETVGPKRIIKLNGEIIEVIHGKNIKYADTNNIRI